MHYESIDYYNNREKRKKSGNCEGVKLATLRILTYGQGVGCLSHLSSLTFFDVNIKAMNNKGAVVNENMETTK